MKNLLSPILILTLALAGGGLSAHAAGDDDGHGHDKNAAIGKPGDAAQISRTVEIVLNDNYYEPESIAVKAGETIRFVVKNQGRLVHEFNIGTADMHTAHKSEMLMMMQMGVLLPDRIDHEKMESGGDDGHGMMKHGMMKHDDHEKMESDGDGGHGMMKHGMMKHDDHEKMESDGDGGHGMMKHSMKHDDPNSVLLEPGKDAEIVWKFADATELEFACNVPGHYEAGMVGNFTWN